MTGYQSIGACSTGNCQFCDQNGDCVLLAILQKVEKLENTIERLTSQATA